MGDLPEKRYRGRGPNWGGKSPFFFFFSIICHSRESQASAPLHPASRLITSISRMTFGFLGFGKMASALIEGMLKAGCCGPDDIVVINRHPESAVDDVKALGIRYATSPRAVVDQTDAVILGTKPADSLQLLKDVRQYLDGKLLISVAAGVNIDRLQEAAGHRTRVIRAMPNTPSL